MALVNYVSILKKDGGNLQKKHLNAEQKISKGDRNNAKLIKPIITA